MPEFRAILALGRDNVDALGNLGLSRFFQDDHVDVIPSLRVALKLQPALRKVQMPFGMADKRTGDTQWRMRDERRATEPSN